MTLAATVPFMMGLAGLYLAAKVLSSGFNRPAMHGQFAEMSSQAPELDAFESEHLNC